MKKNARYSKNKIFLFISIKTNKNVEKGRNFDLYFVKINNSDLKKITFFDGFKEFTLLSPSDNYPVLPSNRNQKKIGDTNPCLAEWNYQ